LVGKARRRGRGPSSKSSSRSIGKLVATSHDPKTCYLLEKDTMPLIHESYDSLPCMFNLDNLGSDIVRRAREGDRRDRYAHLGACANSL
jgi:hypothetical protein